MERRSTVSDSVIYGYLPFRIGFFGCLSRHQSYIHLPVMQETDPTLEELVQRADAQHLIDDFHISSDHVTLRVGARDLEMSHPHAVRFLQGLLTGFQRALGSADDGSAGHT